MRKLCTAAFCVCVFLASCDIDGTSGNYKFVDYDLCGTWERDTAAFWPEGQTVTSQKGNMILTYDTITISGPLAHLQGFTRGTPLEAYTEDGKLHINDRGAWQSPIPYTRWHSGGSYPYDEMLTLKGGGVADETLKQIEE
jgi:hypothetical protein